jgi:thiol-disulfide isomerase/thioredoxin
MTASSSPRGGDRLGRWKARTLRRASRLDIVCVSLLVVLAALSIYVGRHANAQLSPRAASENSHLLDDLDQPTRLPNAPLRDSTTNITVPLWERTKNKPKTVIAFYAPWCEPCQKELPELKRTIEPHAEVVVVVSADEDLELTRRQLANLGLGTETRFLIDETNALAKEGRVTALPTTFLIGLQGVVLQRVRGFSSLQIYRMRRRVMPESREGLFEP